MVQKAHQCLNFLRRLWKFGLSTKTLNNFYRCSIVIILSSYVTAWYGSCSVQYCHKLQKVVNEAQSITQTSLPSLDTIYTFCCFEKADSITKDHMHPGHAYFHLCPSGKRYKSLRARSNRLKNSFFLAAIRLWMDIPRIKLISLDTLTMMVTLHSLLSISMNDMLWNAITVLSKPPFYCSRTLTLYLSVSTHLPLCGSFFSELQQPPFTLCPIPLALSLSTSASPISISALPSLSLSLLPSPCESFYLNYSRTRSIFISLCFSLSPRG